VSIWTVNSPVRAISARPRPSARVQRLRRGHTSVAGHAG
jgi:hypothetical protein